MANKQDNRPNVDHTNHSSDSESDSVDSSRSETDVQETTTGVLETRPEPLTRDDSVREGQHITIGGVIKDLEVLELNMRSDSSAVKDFQQATINPSGDDLPEGRTNYPVQPLELEERNTIGSRARGQQSLREDSEVTKLRSEFEEFKRSAKINAEEVEDLQISLIEVKSDYEEGISTLQSNLETFKKTVMEDFQDIIAAVSEMRKNLIDMESANEAERETLKKAMEETMQQLVSLLAQQMKGMRIDTGLLPDDTFQSLWRDFLSQPNANFKQGGVVYIDPLIISCKSSIGPNGNALVYVRESFEGLWKCIGEQADTLPASMTTATTTPITGPGDTYLVTGTPGTGKSCFAYFLLHHLLAKEGDSVLYQNCHKDVNFWVFIRCSEDSRFEIEHYHMTNNSVPKSLLGFLGKGKNSVEKRVSWYIFDSGHKSGAKPESTDVPTIVISSPDCDQYKDFMQMCPEKFYMPTWEWKELDAVVQQLHPDKSKEMNESIQKAEAEYEKNKIDKTERKKRKKKARQSFTELARAREAFSRHGGVIRECLNPDSEGQLEALHKTVGRSNVGMVVKFVDAIGDVPCTVSHRILHQKCNKKKLETELVDYQTPLIVFASDYIAKRFWDSCLQNEAANQAIFIFNMTFRLLRGNLPHICGQNFESLAHNVITGECSKVKRIYMVKPLHCPENPEPSLEEKQIDKLEFNFKHRINNVKYEYCEKPVKFTIPRSDREEEAYLIPTKGCPAFDAFLPGQKIFLQMTISKKHPVVAPVLLSFLRLREPEWKPEDVSFVFVILEANYMDFPYQEPKWNESNSGLEAADREAFRKIKQYALPLPSPDQMYEHKIGNRKLPAGDHQYPFYSQAFQSIQALPSQ